MNLSNESKLKILAEAVARMATLGYRFEELLDGIKLYNEHRGTLDIDLFEQVNAVFVQAIIAFDEQLRNYHALFTELKDYLD